MHTLEYLNPCYHTYFFELISNNSQEKKKSDSWKN